MTDIGYMSYFLVVEISQIENDIFVSQKKYVNEKEP